MTTFRFCTFNNRPCGCDDAAMQPCAAGLIERYVDEIRDALVTGEEDRYGMYFCRQGLQGIYQTFPTWAAIKRNLEGP